MGGIKMKKVFINFNTLNKSQMNDLWKFVFDRADAFSFRFPNSNHSTSNIMKLKYNDNAQIDTEFCDYMNKNYHLINECYKNLINKSITNRYLDDKYSNLSLVFKCEIFDYLKSLVFKKPNLFEWLEPNLPEDLSFYINDKLFMYTCSHEDICILYLDNQSKNIFKIY